MRFRFSFRVTLIGLLLIAAFCRLSYWQWQRHLYKLEYIKELQSRLQVPVSPAKEVFSDPDPKRLHFRRVHITGSYDFKHEMLLRNRKHEDVMGVHVITPLRIGDSGPYLLVDRGFIPLSKSEPAVRTMFQTSAAADFVGLVKESSPRRFLAPRDPPSGPGNPWADAWLRVDVAEMGKQLPYPVLPIFVEIMGTLDAKEVEAQVVTSSAGREELFNLTSRANLPRVGSDFDPALTYPIPSFDTVAPPDIHLGYVFEWLAMAVGTLLICLILQLKRPGSVAPR